VIKKIVIGVRHMSWQTESEGYTSWRSEGEFIPYGVAK